jgi:hypothetical protein
MPPKLRTDILERRLKRCAVLSLRKIRVRLVAKRLPIRC